MHLFFFKTIAIGRKPWYITPGRPMLHTHQFHARRTGCSAPMLCTFQQRITTLLQTLLESGGEFAKGKMRTKSSSLSSHSLPASLPNCTNPAILCVNKTCLFVYFWRVELQNSAKHIPDVQEVKHKCSHFPLSVISLNKLTLLSHPFILLRLHCCFRRKEMFKILWSKPILKKQEAKTGMTTYLSKPKSLQHHRFLSLTCLCPLYFDIARDFPGHCYTSWAYTKFLDAVLPWEIHSIQDTGASITTTRHENSTP